MKWTVPDERAISATLGYDILGPIAVRVELRHHNDLTRITTVDATNVRARLAAFARVPATMDGT
jgi:hypothetical protein